MKRTLLLWTAALACAAAVAADAHAPLPDLLTFADGRPVKTAADWAKRRAEVAAAILPVEYGRLPAKPAKVTVETVSMCGSVRWLKADFRTMRVSADMDGKEVSFLLELWYPVNDEKDIPVLLVGDGCWRNLREEVVADAIGRGWMVAQFNRCEFAPDDASAGDSTLLKWAWAYHRAIDALEQADERVGPIYVTGHSRGGKTVLLAAATDTRIAAVGDNCSGCGGAGSLRDVPEGAEDIASITRRFPYWFAPDWGSWAGREKELPFDQHFLEALIAPRKLFVRAGADDLWADPPGCRRILEAARPVWTLLGAESNAVYSVRSGGHRHDIADFKAFLDFAAAR